MALQKGTAGSTTFSHDLIAHKTMTTYFPTTATRYRKKYTCRQLAIYFSVVSSELYWKPVNMFRVWLCIWSCMDWNIFFDCSM